MYFRRKKTGSGKVLQLVESFRNSEGQPRQRVRLSLGDADLPESLWAEVAQGVEARLNGQAFVFPPAGEAAQWIDQVVRRMEANQERRPTATAQRPVEVQGDTVDGVRIDQVSHGDTTALGPALVAHRAWQALGMPELLEALAFSEVQQKALAVNVINRLVDPVSENRLPEWQFSTSLPELLGRESLPTSNDRFYRVCDQALLHKTAIEAHLRGVEAKTFSLERTILLYDLTNTYFEGGMASNEKARRGKSKEKRDDCPQVVVGVVFDGDGFELAHEVFEGNQNDAASMATMVSRLRMVAETGARNQKPLVIIDGGIASRENRRLLNEAGLDFLANESRPGRTKYLSWFAEEDAFTVVPGRTPEEAVLVRCLKDPLTDASEEADTLILCKSAGRRDKEQAMLSRAEERFLAAAGKLQERIAKGRLKKADAMERAIGRLQTKNPRVARYYDLSLTEGKLLCQRKECPIGTAEELHGCYVLRTSVRQPRKAEEWWRLYMTLTRAEEGFRTLKSDLGLRPIRHQRADRGDSHIFISILAYHVLHFILHKLRAHHDHRSWETIRRILATHCYTTIVLPTAAGPVHRLRRPGRPDARQQEIYNRLDIDCASLPRTHLAT